VEETESLGKYLKKERELRNISLREVSKNTKVKEHLLKAIEEDQYFSLPSHTYIKGFLLSYAKYLGLDPNDVLFRFEGSLKGKALAPPEVPSEKRTGRNVKYLLGIGGAAIVGLLVSYALFLGPSKTTMESPPAKPKVEEVLPSPPQIAATPSVPEEQPFSLQLKAVEETWVRIQIDGEPNREMTLKPGESTSCQALKRVHLLVGNAGGLDIIFKGKSQERFGKSGEVVNLTFTPQGVETNGPEKSKPQ
jgi:transcriptional regulator with XRE-family HTH domain